MSDQKNWTSGRKKAAVLRLYSISLAPKNIGQLKLSYSRGSMTALAGLGFKHF